MRKYTTAHLKNKAKKLDETLFLLTISVPWSMLLILMLLGV